ncbi:MAG: acetyl-CoA carboxylase biotin carboxyl carrier protein subunit, partial [Ketobacter sp.]
TGAQNSAADEDVLGVDSIAIESHVAGNIWQWKVKPGQRINRGDVVCILESMKMEIEVIAQEEGVVQTLCREQGQQVNAGQRLLVVSTD